MKIVLPWFLGLLSIVIPLQAQLPLATKILQVSEGFPEDTGKVLLVYSENSLASFQKEILLQPGDNFYNLMFQKIHYLQQGVSEKTGAVTYFPYKIFFCDRSSNKEIVYQRDGYHWKFQQTEQGAAANP